MLRSLAVVLICTAPAIAQEAAPEPETYCLPRAQLVAEMTSYGARLMGLGMIDGGGMLEVYVAEATGVWTTTITLPNGVACAVAGGSAWIALPQTGDPA